MSRRLVKALALALAVSSLGSIAPAQDATLTANPILPTVPLTISSGRAVHRFRVEVARTGDQQERGLMFRTRLGHHAGMIFPMDPPREATFWMKNTLIPLDMVWIRADGTVAGVAANAVPKSLSIEASGEPVAAVLEIAGGEARRQGIKPGDTVKW